MGEWVYNMDPPGRLIGSIYIYIYITRYGRYPAKSILSIIWQLGWIGMVQNTPTGCGNDFPTLLANRFFRFPATFVRQELC